MQRGSLESRSIFPLPLLLDSHLQSFPFSLPVAPSLPSKNNMFKCPSLHKENSLHTSPYKSYRPSSFSYSSSNFLEEGRTFLPSASLKLIPWCSSHALLQAPPDICTCALVHARTHTRFLQSHLCCPTGCANDLPGPLCRTVLQSSEILPSDLSPHTFVQCSFGL